MRSRQREESRERNNWAEKLQSVCVDIYVGVGVYMYTHKHAHTHRARDRNYT